MLISPHLREKKAGKKQRVAPESMLDTTVLLELLENKSRRKILFPWKTYSVGQKVYMHLLNAYCMLCIVQSTGETVLRRTNKVLFHIDIMAHGEDIRTSILSEAVTMRGECRVQQEGKAGPHSSIWEKGGIGQVIGNSF